MSSGRGRAEGASGEGLFYIPDRRPARAPEQGADVCDEICSGETKKLGEVNDITRI